jgi:hypothetical protein
MIAAMRAHTRQRTTRTAFGLLSALAVAAGAAISAAPVASADQHDDDFVLALKQHGVVAVGDPAGMIGWAHWACDQLSQGAQAQHVVQWLDGYNKASAGDFGSTDAVFLRTATIYYCPAYRDAASTIAARGGR